MTLLASHEGVRWLEKAGSELPGGKWPNLRGWELTARPSPRTSRVPTCSGSRRVSHQSRQRFFEPFVCPCLNASQEQLVAEM